MIVFATASEIATYEKMANILGKIDHSGNGIFATTHGVIKPSDMKVTCECRNKSWKPISVEIRPSILILINQPKTAKIFYGERAGLPEFEDEGMNYIPSNDGTKGADPVKTLAFEMDHFRDLNAWFGGQGIKNSIESELESLLSNPDVRKSKKNCETKTSIKLKFHIRREYIKAVKLSHNLHDVGPKAPHIVTGDYPNIATWFTRYIDTFSY